MEVPLFPPPPPPPVHTEKSFRNQILFKSFRLIWEQQTNSVRLIPNQSVNGKYNLISV